MKTAILVHLMAILIAQTGDAQVRTLTPKPDEIIDVRAALGIATLIYLPAAVLPSIIGDQTAFRIDTLPSGVSVKPIRAGARTNLYLMTEKERFNFRLSTFPADRADFVVYIGRGEPEQETAWTESSRESATDQISIRINRIGRSRRGFLLFDGVLRSSALLKIRPEDFWITQKKESVVIDSLFVSQREARPGNPIRFALALAVSDLSEKKPLLLEFRGQRSISLALPDVTAWK